MVGRVGYAPTTPAMSMQYSTIELTALKKSDSSIYLNFVFCKNIRFFITSKHNRKIYPKQSDIKITKKGATR